MSTFQQPSQPPLQTGILNLQQLESTANTVSGAARGPSPVGVKYLPQQQVDVPPLENYQKRSMPTQQVQPQQRARAMVQPQRKPTQPNAHLQPHQEILSQQHQQLILQQHHGQQTHEIVTADGRVMIIKGQPVTYSDGTQQYMIHPGIQPTLQTTLPPAQPVTPQTQTISRAAYSALDLQQHQVIRGPPPGTPHMHTIQQAHPPQFSHSAPPPVLATHPHSIQRVVAPSIPTQQTQQVGVTRPMYSALQPAPIAGRAVPVGLTPRYTTVPRPPPHITSEMQHIVTTISQHLHQPTVASFTTPRMYSALQPPQTSTQSVAGIRPIYSALHPPQGTVITTSTIDGQEVLDTPQYLRDSTSPPRQGITTHAKEPVHVSVAPTEVGCVSRESNSASWQSAAQIQELMARSGSNSPGKPLYDELSFCSATILLKNYVICA